jgi:hypothetical protein
VGGTECLLAACVRACVVRMARDRVPSLDADCDGDHERRAKLQEKNRRAQQAFRWRQKVRGHRGGPRAIACTHWRAPRAPTFTSSASPTRARPARARPVAVLQPSPASSTSTTT